MDEAELLLTEVLQCQRYSLYLNSDTPLPAGALRKIASALKRRGSGEPLQYILGKTEFMGFEFRVDARVFIPRPETEILVEAVLKYAPCVLRHSPCVTIVDVGTGSGCIGISLAKFLPDACVTALDISAEALTAAAENARLNNTEVHFIRSDLFTKDRIRNTKYDIIVSNPPYIPTGEIETMQPELQWEPRIALDGGEDGLKFYRAIIDEVPAYLRKGGFLIMEMGFNQKEAVVAIFKKHAEFSIKEIVKDYNCFDRVIILQKNA